MSQVGRQVRKETLDVLAFAVPGDEPHDGKGMAQIVKARLVAGILRTRYAGFFAQAFEDKLGCLASDRLTPASSEQWGCLGAYVFRPLSIDIVAEDIAEIGSDWHETALEELCLTDGQDASISIEIVQLKTQSLTDA